MNWEVIGYICGFLTITGFIVKLFERITRLETKVELFWGTMKKAAADLLHSPHTPEFDMLLEKSKADKLTRAEAMRLKELLLEERKTGDKISQFVAALMLAEMDINGDKK